MVVGDDFGGWVNVQAVPDNVLLPGDPRPSPLKLGGPDTVVDCAVCP